MYILQHKVLLVAVWSTVVSVSAVSGIYWDLLVLINDKPMNEAKRKIYRFPGLGT